MYLCMFACLSVCPSVRLSPKPAFLGSHEKNKDFKILHTEGVLRSSSVEHLRCRVDGEAAARGAAAAPASPMPAPPSAAPPAPPLSLPPSSRPWRRDLAASVAAAAAALRIRIAAAVAAAAAALPLPSLPPDSLPSSECCRRHRPRRCRRCRRPCRLPLVPRPRAASSWLVALGPLCVYRSATRCHPRREAPWAAVLFVSFTFYNSGPGVA